VKTGPVEQNYFLAVGKIIQKMKEIMRVYVKQFTKDFVSFKIKENLSFGETCKYFIPHSLKI
jgi:hypothetical protein